MCVCVCMLRESWGKSRTRTPAVREASGALGGFPGASVVKNLPANAGDSGDAGSTPGSGRSPGRGHGDPLQYSWNGVPESHGQKSLADYSPWGCKE